MPYFFAIIGTVLVPLLLIIGLIRPRTFARKGAVPSRGKVVSYSVLAFVASLVGLIATLPEGEVSAPAVAATAPKETPPDVSDQIVKYSSRITKVSATQLTGGREYLRIDLHMAEGWSGASTFNAAAQEMMRVLEALKVKHPGEFDNVNFNLTADLVDKYNNKSVDGIIGVTFSMPEVEKVNFDNLPNQRLLDGFAIQAGGTRVGDEILADWCKENRKRAAKFCKLVGE